MKSITPDDVLEAIRGLSVSDQDQIRKALGWQSGELNSMAMMQQMMGGMEGEGMKNNDGEDGRPLTLSADDA